MPGSSTVRFDSHQPSVQGTCSTGAVPCASSSCPIPPLGTFQMTLPTCLPFLSCLGTVGGNRLSWVIKEEPLEVKCPWLCGLPYLPRGVIGQPSLQVSGIQSRAQAAVPQVVQLRRGLGPRRNHLVKGVVECHGVAVSTLVLGASVKKGGGRERWLRIRIPSARALRPPPQALCSWHTPRLEASQAAGLT